MRKFSVFLPIVLISLLFFVGFAEAVSIKNPLSHSSFSSLIGGIANAIAGLVGAIATIMFILAGFYFLTSLGDPAKLQKAKDCLKYAIIGTAIALLAGPVVNEVISWF